MDLGSPLPPRTFTLRSTHAAAAAAAATAPSTGRGVSAGPAPSDARTGISGGAAAMDTAGTEVGGLLDYGCVGWSTVSVFAD